MRVSVILSTYNAVDKLERALHGYAAQDYRDFDVIVADDGSTETTRAWLAQAPQQLGLTVRHLWQEDRGFRKCRILNRAILATPADYLIFSDGDCVPRRDFVGAHVRHSARGYYQSGGYFKLGQSLSEAISQDHVRSGEFCKPSFLRRQAASMAWAWSWKVTRLGLSPGLATFCDRLTTTRPTWNGHNASCWRDDALRVNGFDERMGYGGEDREFGERLTHAGVRSKQIRHRAIVMHLWHEPANVDTEGIERNLRLRAETHDGLSSWTPHGLDGHEGYENCKQAKQARGAEQAKPAKPAKEAEQAEPAKDPDDRNHPNGQAGAVGSDTHLETTSA